MPLRAAAAHALGRMGDSGKAALPELASTLVSGVGVAHYLEEYGAADIPVWLAAAALRPDATDETSNAFFALQLLEPKDERLIPLLVGALGHPNLDVRWSAVVLLADMREMAAPAHPALVLLLEQEPDRPQRAAEYFSPERIRQEAAFALGCIGANPERTVQLLTGMLTHDEPGIRKWSALGLGQMGAEAKAAIPHLIDMLVDEKSSLPAATCIYSAHPEHAASTALVNIGEHSIPALAQALKANSSKVRLRAAEALMYFGPRAESAKDDLIRLLQDRDEDVRCTVAAALSWIAPHDQLLVTELLRLTHAKEPKVRAAGVTTLGVLGLKQKAIPLDRILRLIGDPDPDVRKAALGCLTAVAPRETVASAVERLLVDPDDNVRDAAEEAQERLREDE